MKKKTLEKAKELDDLIRRYDKNLGNVPCIKIDTWNNGQGFPHEHDPEIDVVHKFATTVVRSMFRGFFEGRIDDLKEELKKL